MNRSTTPPAGSNARPSAPHRFQRRISGRRAFTLMQVMMSMTIGSIVMSFAIPKVKQSEMQSRATIIAADLRSFASTFETYVQEKGSWPDECAAGVMPPEMADRLGATGWLRPTPIGGQYNWDCDQMHGGIRYKAVISISETASSPLPLNQEILTEIDRLMDDGNLSTGQVRTGVNNDLIYILQQ